MMENILILLTLITTPGFFFLLGRINGEEHGRRKEIQYSAALDAVRQGQEITR